jgi:putative endonuclease
MKTYYVYLLASRRNGTLYCGITNDLVRRVWEHRNATSGFSAKCDVTNLVWFEEHNYAPDAIRRETSIKGWLCEWKIALIEKTNPQWRDLYDSLLPHPLHSTILHRVVIPGEAAQPRRPRTQERRSRSAPEAAGFRVTPAAFPE